MNEMKSNHIVIACANCSVFCMSLGFLGEYVSLPGGSKDTVYQRVLLVFAMLDEDVLCREKSVHG